jgi:hypothetical protein
MKKDLIYYFVTLTISILFVCCQKVETNSIPPGPVSDLTAIPKNQAVWISWTNPVDVDFVKTKIVFDGNIIEIQKSENSALITELDNGKEYTFEISTADLSGNYSAVMTIKSTPDKYVTKLTGKETVDGTYLAVNSSFPRSIVIKGNQYKRTLQGGATKYIWEGTWQKENDTTYTFDYEYYTDDFRGIVHVADMLDKYNSAFCFDYADTTFYMEQAYEKIEGSMEFFPGLYKSYRKNFSEDEPSYSDTTYQYVSVTTEGLISFHTVSADYTSNETANWTNQDLLDGNYLFVTINCRTYLIDRKKIFRFAKVNSK